MSKLVSDNLTNTFAGKAPVMIMQHLGENRCGVTWAGDGAAGLEASIRTSWESHVFQPGERVTLDPGLDGTARAGFAAMLHAASRNGGCGLPVTRTIITVSLRPTGRVFDVTCELAGCEGRWPHENLVDARPIDRVFGTIATRGVSSWLIPLVEGGDMQRDYRADAVLLRARLERRAQYALGAERVRSLPPLLGEFLVARGTGETGALYAALWTSPLHADECAAALAMLDDIRSERRAASRDRLPLGGPAHWSIGTRSTR